MFIAIGGAVIITFFVTRPFDMARLKLFNYQQLVMFIAMILLSICWICGGTIGLWRIIHEAIRERKLQSYEYLKWKLFELYEKLRGNIADTKEGLAAKVAETELLITQRDQLLSAVNTVNETCEKATQELQQLKKDYDNKLLKKTELEKDAEDLTKLAENELSRLNILKKEIKNNQNAIESLQLELTTTRSQSILVKSNYEQLQKEYEEANKKFAEFKKEESELTAKNEPLKAEINKCRDFIDTEPNPAELQEELISLQEKCKQLKEENSRLLPRVEPLRVDHSRLRESVAGLATQVKEAEDQNNEFKRILQQKSTSLSQIQQENVNLRKEAQQLEKKIPKLQQELALEKAKKQDIEQQITNLEQKSQQASKNTAVSEKKLGIIRQSLEALKEKDNKNKEIMRRAQELLQLIKAAS
ncbi:MAG: hypothetical protein WC908_03395 [Candidatus Paceibacterota bacterium]